MCVCVQDNTNMLGCVVVWTEYMLNMHFCCHVKKHFSLSLSLSLSFFFYKEFWCLVQHAKNKTLPARHIRPGYYSLC